MHINDYWTLGKPGIMSAVLLTTVAGFSMAAPGIDWRLLLHTLTGTALVSMGAGSLNMLLEIEIDRRMTRTMNRPLPSRRITAKGAFCFGALCSILGLTQLYLYAHAAATIFAGLSLFIYLALYTPLKKITPYCTVVGAISGALPPLIGWSAVTGSLGAGAWMLFAVLFVWQFPHLLALAWMYQDDYQKSGILLLPQNDEDGLKAGRIAFYSSLLLAAISLVPYLTSLAGIVYLMGAVAGGLVLIMMSHRFLVARTKESAKGLFLASVSYVPLLTLCLLIAQSAP